MTTTRDPSAAAAICQKPSGYSWTSRWVDGSKAQFPPGNASSWKSVKRVPKARAPTIATTTAPIAAAPPPRDTARQMA